VEHAAYFVGMNPQFQQFDAFEQPQRLPALDALPAGGINGL